MNLTISAVRWPIALCVVAASAFLVARQNPIARLFHIGRGSDDQRALKPGEARQSQLDLAHEHSAEFTVAVPSQPARRA